MWRGAGRGLTKGVGRAEGRAVVERSGRSRQSGPNARRARRTRRTPRPGRTVAAAQTEEARDVVAQIGQHRVEDVTRTLRGHVVAVTDDRLMWVEVIAVAQPRERLDEGFPEPQGGPGADVDALVLDAECVAVVTGRLRAEDVPALVDGLQGTVAALHDEAAAADRELVSGVAPAVGELVQVLDPAREPERLVQGEVGDVVRRGVVDDEVVGLVDDLCREVRGPRAPLGSGVDARSGGGRGDRRGHWAQAGRGSGEGEPAGRRGGTGQDVSTA